MKKIISITLVVILIAFILIIGIYFVTGFSIFKPIQKTMGSITDKKGNEIEVEFDSYGATTNDVVNVYIKKSKTKIKIGMFENYNYLNEIGIQNDTLLKVVLNDTGYWKNKPDTFFIKLKK